MVEEYYVLIAWNSIAITQQPENTFGAAGETATFTVRAAGDNLSYQWEYSKDGGEIWIPCTSQGCDEADFSFKIKASISGRQYRCVVTDDDNNRVTSNAATVALFAIKSQPEDATADVGEQFSVAVKAAGDGLKYTWRYKNVGMSEFKDVTSIKKATYTAVMRDTWEGRQQYCVITDKYGNSLTTDIVTFHAVFSFSITAQPQDVTATADEEVTLTVATEGSGLSFRWQYSKDGGITWENCRSAGSDTDTFRFTMTKKLNGRLYRCRVTDGTATLNSDTATITLFGITRQPQDVNAASGTKVTLTVKAVGDGLTYQWQYLKPGETEWISCSSSGSNTASFSFRLKATLNGRQYRCLVMDVNKNSVFSEAVMITVE